MKAATTFSTSNTHRVLEFVNLTTISTLNQIIFKWQRYIYIYIVGLRIWCPGDNY